MTQEQKYYILTVWEKQADGSRVKTQEVDIPATSAIHAARVLAKQLGLTNDQWNTGPSPLVIIRHHGVNEELTSAFAHSPKTV